MTQFTESVFRDFYEVLGVSPKADEAVIRQAYLARLKAWHPDKNPGSPEKAGEMTKILNEAYFVLSDSERRKQYDRMRRFTRGKNFYDYLNDKSFADKMKQAAPVFKNLQDNVRELYSLFVDAAKNRYKLNPARLGIVGSGLLYFIIPTDFIPDFIPMFGMLDDLSILTLVMNSLQEELSAYRLWKKRT
ncbi:MAG: DnaJ domain-containing protein [Desulfosudaceae bacterium]